MNVPPNDEVGNRAGNGYSASVSVSVSSPAGLLRLAGLPDRLNTFTVSSPASFSAKCTRGVLGALCARKCLRAASAKSPTTFGEDVLDLSEGFSGRPFARMMGELGVRGIDEPDAVEPECVRPGRVSGMNGDLLSVGDNGDEVGNGTFDDNESGENVLKGALVFGISMCEGGLTDGEKRPDSMDRRREFTAGRAKCPGLMDGDEDGE